ncbi:hypothetical protein BT96DRAFT_949558 [Gymnopus androsaceus JB14]|uniref:Uncharacterized protein n=1 Tax=Gymnopus androsaceus JB14 TaxID=1447944 RepID=A0A6A4GJV3_9AGAR|nr:hypothetical protein BT96DRAFT_949558 [Gymnopus androsaceus JB14]
MKTLSHPLLGNQQIPQPFNEQTAYLCLIPYPYTLNATNTAPWTVPSESAFEPINGHRPSQNPLGLIPEDSVCALETHFHNLSTSFSQLPPSERSISSFHSSRMKDYKNWIRFLLNRLRTPMLRDEHCALELEALQTWNWIRFLLNRLRTPMLRDERCALELEALQTWVTSVGPTWDTQPFVVHALRDVIGALTEQPAVAQKLYQAGILVWFFRKLCHLNDLLLVGCWSTETNPIPIRTLPPQYSFDDSTPLRPILYSSLLNDLSRYKAMGRYSWSQAFPSSVWGLILLLLVCPMCLVQHHVNPKSNKVEPRNKFKDPVSPLLPHAICAWAEASTLVGRDFNHAQPARPGVLRGYVLPEPALFVTQKDDTMQEYLRMYLKLWELRKVNEDQTSSFNIDLSNIRSVVATWNGQKMPGRIPDNVAHDVFYEIFRVSFTQELLMADQYLYEVKPDEHEHEELANELDASLCEECNLKVMGAIPGRSLFKKVVNEVGNYVSKTAFPMGVSTFKHPGHCGGLRIFTTNKMDRSLI